MAEPFQKLSAIREADTYSSTNASKGAMLPELYRMAVFLHDGVKKDKLKRFVFVENGLSKVTYDNRKAIWDRLHQRYFSIWPEWVGEALANAAQSGNQSPEFLSLAYLYFVLRDKLAYDFVTGPLWAKWSSGTTQITPSDFHVFLSNSSETSPEIKKWRETTRSRLVRNTLSALRDFGILKGKQYKYIQRPPVADETVYHLLAILWAEGKRGQGIIDTPDWQLFLWNEADIANAFNKLAQKGWIRFERGGQTVILEMIRHPGVQHE